MSDDVTPFRLAVPEAELDDLRERLRRTRWPERETVDDWSQGVPLDYLQDLCRYWADDYDWRPLRGPAERAAASSAPTSTGGRRHPLPPRPSPQPDALPLHAHPRLARFGRRVPRSRRPAHRPGAHGGDPADAFHVVMPVAAGLRVQRQAGRARLGRRAHRRGVGAAHGPARLRPLRRPGRRLGRGGHGGARVGRSPSTWSGST